MTVQKVTEFNTLVGDVDTKQAKRITAKVARDTLGSMLKDVQGSLMLTSSNLTLARSSVKTLEQEWDDLEDARIAIGEAIKALDGDG